MATAPVLSGICLFALLIGDICCVPVQKGNDPAAYTNDGYRYAASGPQPAGRSAPGFGPQPAPRSGYYSPPSYVQVPRSSKQTAAEPVQTSGHAPAVYGGSGHSAQGFGSAPAAYSAQHGGSGHSAQGFGSAPAAYSAQHGGSGHSAQGFGSAPAAYSAQHSPGGAAPKDPMQSGLAQDWYDWPVLPDGGSEAQLAPEGFGPGYVSPPFVAPVYQAGELSSYEGTAEQGFYERESEEQGSPPVPPYFPPQPHVLAPEVSTSSTSFPHPPIRPSYGGFYPYYYDYRFLTGQYPPGTYTHSSASFNRGRDGSLDIHYLRENPPYQAEPVQTSDTSVYSAASQSGKVPVYTKQ